MKIKLSQIKSRKCHCGIWDKETGIECEACPFDSSFSKNHWMTTGYYCKIDDYNKGLIPDMEIDLKTCPDKNITYEEYKYEIDHYNFNKKLLKYLELKEE